MISEISDELFRNTETLKIKTDMIRRIRKFCVVDGRSYTTDETFDKEFKIVVVKEGKEVPYLKTKHMTSILDAIGLHVMHINIARDVIDRIYEESFYKEKNGIAIWTPEEIIELTIEMLEDEVEDGNNYISYNEIIFYRQTH